MRKVISEILVLAAVSHPNIVRFLGCCLNPYVLLIMEFVSGGRFRVERELSLIARELELIQKLLARARRRAPPHGRGQVL